jgi:hypothetical protein
VIRESEDMADVARQLAELLKVPPRPISKEEMEQVRCWQEGSGAW